MTRKALEVLWRVSVAAALTLLGSCRSETNAVESTNYMAVTADAGESATIVQPEEPNREKKQSLPKQDEAAPPLVPIKMVKKGSALKSDSFAAPLRQTRTALVEFEMAPFPYRGYVPQTNKPFLDVVDGNRRGHRTWSGHVFWEDETFNDNRVLLHIPKGFDFRRPALMVVFLHGHGATLQRDVWERQRVPAQVSEAGINAVLVAPQLAFDASDSSAGKFWEPGGFARFLEEASVQLARLHGDPRSKQAFERMPIVIMAYSGGYLTAASCIHHGGASSRVRGVVLLDALYGEIDKFAAWISNHNKAFFVSAYANSTRARNAELETILKERDVAFNTTLQRPLRYGSVTFISTASETLHRDFVTEAWAHHPIKDLLQRLRADVR